MLADQLPNVAAVHERAGGDVEIADYTRLPAEPLVSVDMITFNHAAHIREALDSILMQQVDFPYEICIGEDGSSDGTREICIEYASRYPDKIRLFLRNRNNPERAKFKAPFMYNCIETFVACRGKYIAILEGDDYWINSRKLAAQVKALELAPSYVFVAAYTLVRDTVAGWRQCRIIPNCQARLITLDGLFWDNDVHVIHVSSLLLRRLPTFPFELFRDMPCGDTTLLFWYLSNGNALLMDDIFSVYRYNNQGAYSSLGPVRNAKFLLDFWQRLSKFVQPRHQQDVSRWVVRRFCNLILQERLHAGMGAALRAWRDLNRYLRNTPHVSTIQRVQTHLAAIEILLFPWGIALRRYAVRKVASRLHTVARAA